MIKAVLIMVMPEICRDCKWCSHLVKFCGVCEEFMEDITIRQDWCPLRKLPDKLQTKQGCDYPDGWNDCLDKLEE